MPSIVAIDEDIDSSRSSRLMRAWSIFVVEVSVVCPCDELGAVALADDWFASDR